MFANETASFRLPNFDGGKLKLKLETGYRVQSINQHSFGTSKVSQAQQPSSSAALIPYQIQSENLINMQISAWPCKITGTWEFFYYPIAHRDSSLIEKNNNNTWRCGFNGHMDGVFSLTPPTIVAGKRDSAAGCLAELRNRRNFRRAPLKLCKPMQRHLTHTFN